MLMLEVLSAFESVCTTVAVGVVRLDLNPAAAPLTLLTYVSTLCLVVELDIFGRVDLPTPEVVVVVWWVVSRH
jgi:hypothetical protein